MKKKKIIAVLLTIVFLFNTNIALFAEDVSKYIKNFYTSQDDVIGEVTITGKRPSISGMNDKNLESELNRRILNAYSEEIKAVADNFATINFDYTVKQNDPIVSILMYTTITSDYSREKIVSFNYDTQTRKMIWLDAPNVLGTNAVKLANKAILANINANPLSFNTTFSGISETQDFYVEDNKVVLLFDDSEIAPAHEGIKTIEIPKRSIKDFILERSKYYDKKNSYNLKMIPLSLLLTESDFGYTINWKGDTQQIFIYKDNQYITTLTIGQNQYSKGQTAKRQLEAAPEIRTDDNRTYVPISFFEEILDISYSVDYGGKITFSQYTP